MISVEVRQSTIHGQGVFAAQHADAGTPILEIDDSRVVDERHPLHPDRGESPSHCDYLAKDRVVLMQEPERYVNSSCDPNCFIATRAGTRTLIARKAVRAGEELTCDYIINCHGGEIWTCRCGASRCRGTIVASFFDLPLDLQAEYFSLLDEWFIEEHAARI